MFEIKGHYNTAYVMARSIDDETAAQIRVFLNHPAFAEKRIVIMPDCHAGMGAVIGFTMELGDSVIPNVIGVDIGCGIESCRAGIREVDFALLDAFIRREIPSGFAHREHLPDLEGAGRDWYDGELAKEVRKLAKKVGLTEERVLLSAGTLGGGNHFLELDRASDGAYWFTVHTGSRHFGLQVANWHQKKAKELVRKTGAKVPTGLEALPMNQGGEEYLDDMRTAQRFAALNRRIIVQTLLQGFFGLDADRVPTVRSVHNFIDFEDRVIRKGAISARKGERLVIPLSMRDGVILGTGKGVGSWNRSAPHGAGRLMSRRKAKETIALSDFKKSMEGVWSSCVNRSTLDESPFAYKAPEEILSTIGETAEVEEVWKPVYNFKAGE